MCRLSRSCGFELESIIGVSTGLIVQLWENTRSISDAVIVLQWSDDPSQIGTEGLSEHIQRLNRIER